MTLGALTITALDVDRAARISFAVLPAMLVGYCAGRLRNSARARSDDDTGGPDRRREADLSLTRDLDRRIAVLDTTYRLGKDDA